MIRSIQSLKDQFYSIQPTDKDEHFVYWSLWEGTNRKLRRAYNEVLGDQNASWEYLEDTIRRIVLPGRTYEIMFKHRPNYSQGVSLEFNFSTIGGSGVSDNSIAGIGSPGQGGIYTDAQVQDKVNQAVKTALMEKELQDLKEAFHAPSNTVERFAQRVLDFLEGQAGAPIGVAIASKILGVPVQAAQIGLAGFPDDGPKVKNQNTQDSDSGLDSGPDSEIDFDLSDEEITACLYAIQKVIPISKVLPVLAKWISGKNEAQVNQVLNMVKFT